MSAVAIVHVVAGALLPLSALAAAWRAGTVRARVVALACALDGAAVLVCGAMAQRTWEPGYRRAVYLASRSVGAWLDRKEHFGVAACCFAIAAGLTALDRNAPPWLGRMLAALTLAFAIAALVVVAYVHARVPNAALE